MHTLTFTDLGSPSVKPCCLCFCFPEKEDVRDCQVEDVMSALGIKVLRGDKVCVDCSDNLHKFLYFKKKIIEIHSKKKLPKKSKSDIVTQSSVRNKVSKGFRGQEGVGGQAAKDSVEGQEHYSEIETLLVEMNNSTGDQKEDKSYNQKQNSLSADTKVQSEHESLLSDIKKKTISEEKTRKHSKDKTAEGSSTICMSSKTTVSCVGPGVKKSEANTENKVLTAQTLNKTTSETCQPSLAISDVKSLRSGRDSQTNSQFPGISKSLISSSQDQSTLNLGVNIERIGAVETQTMSIHKAALSRTVPPNKFATPPTANVKTKVSSSSTPKATPTMFSMVFSGNPKNYCVVQHPPGTVLQTTNQVLKQPPRIGSVPLTNNQVQKQPPPIGSVPLTNNHVLKQPPPIGSVPLTNNQIQKQPPPIGSVPLTNNQVLKQPPPIGSVPLTNNQVLNQTTPIESVPLANNEIIIQKGGAIMLATQGRGSALPAPISSSTSKMQKTTSYVPIQSKKPLSPQTTQSVTTQVQAKSTTGTLPAPQEDSVGAPSTTKSVNSTPILVSPKLSNLEESKEKDVVAFKNADLSQAAPLPSPMPSAFIRALPKSEETSPPNIQIITNPTSTSQSKTTTPLAVPSMAGNLAEEELMPLRVTDISNYSPQGHSAAARQQTMTPPHVTTEQENPSSRGDSSFIKIGKMTYQLVVKNNQQLLVPGLPQLPYEQRSSTKKKKNLHWLPTDNNFDCRKRKFTFEHPEKV